MPQHIEPSIHALPKAELHVHIEGTITPDMARRKARTHGLTLPDSLFAPDGTRFAFRDFFHLVTEVYQAVASCARSAQDYDDITYDYLRRCANENTLYVELSCAPSQTSISGVAYPDLLEGMADGIDRARKDFGIEARIITTLVRHQPIEESWQDARAIAAFEHPYIVGLDLAGGERSGDVAAHAPLFDHIQQNFGRPLGLRLHAAEAAGPENITHSLPLAPTRIGHGVRSVEDPAVIIALKNKNITLEVCPTSNILAGIYPSFEGHSLHDLILSGVPFTLNSDDPGLFGNSIGLEYQIAHDHFGLSLDDLYATTLRAIDASFAEESLKTALRTRANALNRAA